MSLKDINGNPLQYGKAYYFQNHDGYYIQSYDGNDDHVLRTTDISSAATINITGSDGDVNSEETVHFIDIKTNNQFDLYWQGHYFIWHSSTDDNYEFIADSNGVFLHWFDANGKGNVGVNNNLYYDTNMGGELCYFNFIPVD